jgi:hypothetical protein
MDLVAACPNSGVERCDSDVAQRTTVDGAMDHPLDRRSELLQRVGESKLIEPTNRKGP